MSFDPPGYSQQALLAEIAWLRRLARTLVIDPNEAEDLSQETLLIALKAQPEQRAGLRPWLGRVLRNAAHRRAGRNEQRRLKEAQAFWKESVDSTDELVGHLEIHRKVVDAVIGLPEPYKTAVLLRFWEGLASREVAARLDVPVETVRTRLKRGMAMLRRTLDNTCGGRQAWAAPLIGSFLPKIPSADLGTGSVRKARHASKMLAFGSVAPVLIFFAAACLLIAFSGLEKGSPPARQTTQGSVGTILSATDRALVKGDATDRALVKGDATDRALVTGDDNSKPDADLEIRVHPGRTDSLSGSTRGFGLESILDSSKYGLFSSTLTPELQLTAYEGDLGVTLGIAKEQILDSSGRYRFLSRITTDMLLLSTGGPKIDPRRGQLGRLSGFAPNVSSISIVSWMPGEPRVQGRSSRMYRILPEWIRAEVDTNAEGWFETYLPPGTYRIYCRGLGDLKTSFAIWDEYPIQIQANKRTHHDVRLVRTDVTIRLMADDGRTPLSSREVWLSDSPSVPGQLPLTHLTDQNGRVKFFSGLTGWVYALLWPENLATKQLRAEHMQVLPHEGGLESLSDVSLNEFLVVFGPVYVPNGAQGLELALQVPSGVVHRP